MQIVCNETQLRHYLKTAVEIDEDKPVLVDKYISGKEVEVDAICDGINVFVPGIMELVERTGIHSGDSISVYPPFSISDKVKGILLPSSDIEPQLSVLEVDEIKRKINETIKTESNT